MAIYLKRQTLLALLCYLCVLVNAQDNLEAGDVLGASDVDEVVVNDGSDETSGCCVGRTPACRDIEVEENCSNGCRWRDNCVPGQQPGLPQFKLEFTVTNGDNDEDLSRAQRIVSRILKEFAISVMKGVARGESMTTHTESAKNGDWHWMDSESVVPGMGVMTLEQDANFWELIASGMTGFAGPQTTHTVHITLYTIAEDKIRVELTGIFRWEKDPNVIWHPFEENENNEIWFDSALKMLYTKKDGKWKVKRMVYEEAGGNEYVDGLWDQAAGLAGQTILLGIKNLKVMIPNTNPINIIYAFLGCLMIVLALMVICCYKCTKQRVSI